MKRTLAVVVFLAALGVMLKLAWKGPRFGGEPGVEPRQGGGASVSAEDVLRAKYSDPQARALVDRTLTRYRQTALNIERTDGLRGLKLLDKMDLEAIYLYEKRPNDFRRLRETLNDDAAAEVLVHWSEYFGLKRADDTDRGILIAEIGRLAPAQTRIAAKYPNVLPLLLAEPTGITELVERLGDDSDALADSLAVLDLINLEHGTADLRKALRTLDHHGPLALDAFRLQGPEGFALVTLYGPVLDGVSDALPLDQSLILLRVNTDDVDELLKSRSPEFVAAQIRHIAAVGLVEVVGGSPHALKLAVDYGRRGEQALMNAGPDAADVVYEDYTDATLRQQAVEAMAEHGTMALAMLAKYAADPDFREILRGYGAAVIPPIARADTAPETLAFLKNKPKKSFTESLAQGILSLSGESGQSTIRLIKSDGVDRVEFLQASEVQFYQFLPLYDLIHLGGVVTKGQTPTSGEMAWALVDGCFVVADVLSLTAFQPEGVAAAEAARTEVKTATREAVKAAGRELTGEATEAAARALTRRGAETGAERVVKWWAVRSAGGTYKLLRRMPEALSKIGLPDLVELARPLCSKAGLRLSRFGPMRFLKNGQEILQRIPPSKGLKYIGAQAVQASVGLIAVHKMEEHLSSRRPAPTPPLDSPDGTIQ